MEIKFASKGREKMTSFNPYSKQIQDAMRATQVNIPNAQKKMLEAMQATKFKEPIVQKAIRSTQINAPNIQKQIQDAMRATQINMPDMQKQLQEAMNATKISSPNIQKQIRDAIHITQIGMPNIQKQMLESMRIRLKISPNIQEQIGVMLRAREFSSNINLNAEVKTNIIELNKFWEINMDKANLSTLLEKMTFLNSQLNNYDQKESEEENQWVSGFIAVLKNETSRIIKTKNAVRDHWLVKDISFVFTVVSAFRILITPITGEENDYLEQNKIIEHVEDSVKTNEIEKIKYRISDGEIQEIEYHFSNKKNGEE